MGYLKACGNHPGGCSRGAWCTGLWLLPGQQGKRRGKTRGRRESSTGAGDLSLPPALQFASENGSRKPKGRKEKLLSFQSRFPGLQAAKHTGKTRGTFPRVSSLLAALAAGKSLPRLVWDGMASLKEQQSCAAPIVRICYRDPGNSGVFPLASPM